MSEGDWGLVVMVLAEVILIPLFVFGGPHALRFAREYRAGNRTLWDAIPPYAPPGAPGAWRWCAKLRLCPTARLPCGCRASWSDVNYIHDADPDGTVYETIGDFRGCTREWEDIREVAVDNGGVLIQTDHAPVHTHHECGGTWKEPMGGMRLGPEPTTERLPLPPDSDTMRALPDGWTRMDRGLAEKAGQVTEYVYDETWEAFVDVYDTTHDGNSYDPREGAVCAVLLTGSPSSGLWERDEHYADGRTEAAKPLMRRYNDGEYES